MSIFVHFHSLLDYFNVSLILELTLNSGTLNCGIRNCNSKDLFQKFFWNICEGFCDIILTGTVYFYFSVLHIFLFFVINNSNTVNDFKACCWFHFHFFLITPGS